MAKKSIQDDNPILPTPELEKQNHQLQIRIRSLEIAALEAQKKELEAEIKFLRLKRDHDALLNKTSEEQEGWAATMERAKRHKEREVKTKAHNK